MDVSDEEDETIISPLLPAVAKPKDPTTKPPPPMRTSASSSSSSSSKLQKAQPKAPVTGKKSPISKQPSSKQLSKQPSTKPAAPKQQLKAPKATQKPPAKKKPPAPPAADADNDDDDEEDEDEVFSEVDEDSGEESDDEESDESDEDSDDDSESDDEDDEPLSRKRGGEAEISRAGKKTKRDDTASPADPAASTAIVPAPVPVGAGGDSDTNTGLARTFALLTKTSISMQEVFPSSVCSDIRMEAERVKKELLDPTKPAEDVLYESIAKIIRTMTPHVANDSGVSASSLAVANAANEGLQRAAEAFHLMMSSIKPLEQRALELKGAVMESSEKMQAAYGDLFR